MDPTPLLRPYFTHIARRTDSWGERGADIQLQQLRSLMRRGAASEPGRRLDFATLARESNPYGAFASRVEPHGYEEIRGDVMRMVAGERDVLWPGVCRDFAQSSGTSGGKSKYIPITPDSLHRCHYKGATDSVAHYLRNNPESRIFSGKGMILGGSFANELAIDRGKVNVGDLSATLINKINPLANLVICRHSRLGTDTPDILRIGGEHDVGAMFAGILESHACRICQQRLATHWFYILSGDSLGASPRTDCYQTVHNIYFIWHGRHPATHR